MNKVATQLRELREQTGLTVEQLAAQVGAEASSLRDAEEGTRTPPTAVLARCAMLAGLELDEFLRGASVETPPIALLRTAVEAGADALQALRTDKAPLLCGELLHRARVVQMIEGVCKVPRARLPAVARGPEASQEHPAEEDARRAREALGVEDGPVRSMRALLESYGVLIVWTEDEIPDTIDGISLLQPIPTVLANLHHGHGTYWHTRMTLAHELGHLLFDHLRRGVAVMHSPSVLGAQPPLAGFEDIERGANAFAACFLAPAHLVRRCVGALAPDSEDAVIEVGRRFGVGRTVAINRLQHVFRLSDEVRVGMERRPIHRYDALGREDVPREDEVGLRRGVFRRRVVEALALGMIPRDRAWSLLGLSPSESLDEAPTEELRAPLISRERVMLELARRQFTPEPLQATWGWSPVKATRLDETRWRVQFVQGAGAPQDREVFVTLAENGAVLDLESLDEELSRQFADKLTIDLGRP